MKLPTSECQYPIVQTERATQIFNKGENNVSHEDITAATSFSSSLRSLSSSLSWSLSSSRSSSSPSSTTTTTFSPLPKGETRNRNSEKDVVPKQTTTKTKTITIKNDLVFIDVLQAMKRARRLGKEKKQKKRQASIRIQSYARRYLVQRPSNICQLWNRYVREYIPYQTKKQHSIRCIQKYIRRWICTRQYEKQIKNYRHYVQLQKQYAAQTNSSKDLIEEARQILEIELQLVVPNSTDSCATNTTVLGTSPLVNSLISILKIQALIRGYLVRRSHKVVRPFQVLAKLRTQLLYKEYKSQRNLTLPSEDRIQPLQALAKGNTKNPFSSSSSSSSSSRRQQEYQQHKQQPCAADNRCPTTTVARVSTRTGTGRKSPIYVLDRIITIQAIVRGYLTRRPHRIHKVLRDYITYQHEQKRIRAIQAIARGYLARRPGRIQRSIWDYLQYQQNVISIQAIVRGYLARRPYRIHTSICDYLQYQKETNHAITKIQAIVRGYLARRPYRIQTSIRDYINYQKEKESSSSAFVLYPTQT